MIYFRKSISPVVATALLLVVAVVAVVNFQGWFSDFSSKIFVKTEQESDSSLNTNIDQVIGNSLYFKNGNSDNLTINSVKINGVDCNLNQNVSNGITELNISSCTVNLTSISEAVVYTDNGIYSKKFYIQNERVESSFSSCSLNGTEIANGDDYSFYNSSTVSYGGSCASESRTCLNGVLSGNASFNISSCNVLPFNCSALGLVGGEWTSVPGNTGLGTSDFCVMKFEAKNVTNVATSQAALNPWVSISQNQAKANCSALGSKYHLITNEEWTTIARNAELVGANWNTSVVGSGFMFSGHNDNNPASSLSVSNISNYYDQTGDSSSICDGAWGSYPSIADDVITGRACLGQKRTLILNNSEIVWDMSGNVWEWNNNTCTQGDPWYAFDSIYYEWTVVDINGTEKSLAGPTGIYNSSNGVGKYIGCTTAGNVLLRGGRWTRGADAGVFALYMGIDATSWNSNTGMGFRCAYTP